MPEPSDSTTEAQPLKGEEGPEGSQGSPGHEGKEGGCWKRLGLSHMSSWRTAAFFLALFLCLTIVFAFSFIIPCPVRPLYLRTWNVSYPQAAAYDFLSVRDVNKDKVLDVLFAVKTSEGILNITCAEQSLPSPCVFVTAVAGTNGKSQWELPLAPELHWGQCGLGGLGGEASGCLLSHADKLTAVRHYDGEILWQQVHPPSFSSKLPVLSVPDLDKDGVSDVVLIGPGQAQTGLVILSGKTGTQIGSEVVLDSEEVTEHLLHTTGKDSRYVLLQKASGVYGKALWKIAAQAQAGSEKPLPKDQEWEKRSSADTGQVLISESDSVQYTSKVTRKGKTANILVATADSVELINGDGLQSLWRTNSSRLLSQPSFGHFNKDKIPDVVLEEDAGNGAKRVVILDGKTGGVLWEVKMLAKPNTPKPSSVNTIDSYSIFVFWGEMPPETNASIAAPEELFSFLLNPQYSSVILEKSNIVERIAAFRATLLERGRHACYLTLMGPQGDEPPGTVQMRKRKLKEDVPDSRVLRLGVVPDGETDDQIREAFDMLRFSKDV
ncbi:hypothetical protein GJAV_G00260690 [Gymnothorax javanicus]|nr:hypothetical protein GJAV_G00260690 [Gymnothorax javanicus]